MNVMTGAELYTMTGNLLLGYQMDPTLFYQILGMVQGKAENSRPWVQLRTEAATQQASPQSNQIANSLYLTAFNLPGFNSEASKLFSRWYSPKRSICLVANDGITFRWYNEITLERKQEYKDDNSKFYINLAAGQMFLCGTLDQQYTIHQFYCCYSDTVAAGTSWIFPAIHHPYLAYAVAKEYKDSFDYDVVNAAQARQIEIGMAGIMKGMIDWDTDLQESQLEGVDYQSDNQRVGFLNRVVGDGSRYNSG